MLEDLKKLVRVPWLFWVMLDVILELVKLLFVRVPWLFWVMLDLDNFDAFDEMLEYPDYFE